jgi:hypothetical protein
MPIQNTYVSQVDQRADGTLYLKLIGTVAEAARDEYYTKCAMN